MTKGCPSCGAEFDPLQGRYAPDGTVVCVGCGERMATAAKREEDKSASSAFAGAFGALLVSLLSFVLVHRVIFFLFPLVGITGGAGTAFVALRNQNAIKALGWKRFTTIAIGVLALLLGLLSLVLSFSSGE